MDSPQAIEAAVRESYGRLVAYLSARSRDVAAAEDAVSDALHAALTQWPTAGIPKNPEAWLMAAAKRKWIDATRRNSVRVRATPALQILMETLVTDSNDSGFPDDRLKLLFVCAHPAIDPAVRTPLMLQTVLGLEADEIASAFLVAPTTMAQRLVRAKQKIRDAGIPFSVPEPHDWGERLAFVLEALYSAYTTGWDSCNDVSSKHRGLGAETLALVRILAQLLPREPEAHGLLALILHLEARTAARFNGAGEFVPLDQQDATLWARPLMREAEAHLRAAGEFRRPGRFQLEAAIQSVHASRLGGLAVDWVQIAILYEGLLQFTSSTGAQIGLAVALGNANRLDAAAEVLRDIPADRISDYQPYWVARAHLLKLSGRAKEADETLTRAIGLTENPALRAFLIRQRGG